MGKVSVGSRFHTGNSTVAQLPVDALLAVIGKGQLEVVELPAVEIKAGTRFQSKYGPATVVDFTSTKGFAAVVEDASDDDEVFYIADGTTRVRRTNVANVK